MLILHQNRNISLNIKRWPAKCYTKPIDILKLSTRPFIALQSKEIQLHPSEHRHKFPYQKILTNHWSNPTHRKQNPQFRGTTTFQAAKRAPPKQQDKQNEKAEKYSTGEITWYKTTNQKKKKKKEEIGVLPEKIIQNNDSKDDPKPWK